MSLIPVNLYGRTIDVREDEPGMKESDIPEPIKAAMIERFGELPKRMIGMYQVPGFFALLIIGSREEGLYSITFSRKVRIIDTIEIRTPMLTYTSYRVERKLRSAREWFRWEIEAEYIGPFNDVQDFYNQFPRGKK